LLINIIHYLATWRLPRTSSYSYSRVAMIRIDVHPAWENLTNMTRTLPTLVHVCPSYTFCGRSPYVATFHDSPTELDRVTAAKKNSSQHNTQHVGWAICGSVPSFSPEPTNEAVKKVKHLLTSSYWAYRTHITGMRSIHLILAHGANPSVLNRHRRELQH
jgi:hypothetical protein